MKTSSIGEDRKGAPKKRFGQHFLVNQLIADRIVAHAAPGPGEQVLEIGPGRGVLTERLLASGALVTAVEIDRGLTDFLLDRFGNNPAFTLVEADILSLDLSDRFRGTRGRIKVVSNLPYNISTPVVDLLCRSRKIVKEAVLMVQREVARRLLAKPGSREYGLTTLNLALYACGRALMDVKPAAFSPKPAVMSRVLSLQFSETPLYPLDDESRFRTVTGTVFRHRRKMLRNTLVPHLISLGFTRKKAMDILAESGIDPETRPETVPVERFVGLCNTLAANL